VDTILRCCQRQNDALGPRAVLDMALAQRNLVRGLLVECPTSLKSRLLSTYSNMSTSIGFYYLDLNEFDRSWYHLDQARAAAHDAGTAELGIYALCVMSFAASWHGKIHTALDTAVAARGLLAKTGDPLMRVCVADNSAKAYAVDGQHTASMVELDKAHS